MADSGGPLLLRYARGAQEAQAAAARREQAAASEARANAGSSASEGYSMSAPDAGGASAECAAGVLAHVFVATSAQLNKVTDQHFQVIACMYWCCCLIETLRQPFSLQLIIEY